MLVLQVFGMVVKHYKTYKHYKHYKLYRNKQSQHINNTLQYW